MEQPSLLLQLSSSLHQLNMAVDYTGGEREGKGETRRRGEDLGKGGEAETVTRRREEEERRGAGWRESGGEQGGF